MWDTDVLELRTVAVYDGPLPASLEQLTVVVSDRYGMVFDSCLVNLYRDGSDAVAWHGDTVRKVLRGPLVVTIPQGSRRRFLVRRRGGGPTLLSLSPGEGDLVVMGGAMQHEWEHTVPRDARASGARMSVTMRHSRPAAHATPTAPRVEGRVRTVSCGRIGSDPDPQQPDQVRSRPSTPDRRQHPPRLVRGRWVPGAGRGTPGRASAPGR